MTDDHQLQTAMKIIITWAELVHHSHTHNAQRALKFVRKFTNAVQHCCGL